MFIASGVLWFGHEPRRVSLVFTSTVPAVTPTFQSARLAGWKTGVTKLHGFMAPRRDFEILEALHEPWLRTAAVSEGPAAALTHAHGLPK